MERRNEQRPGVPPVRTNRRPPKPAKKPKKIGTMDVILVVIAVALFAFTLEMIAIFKETGTIPDTLCTCVFMALGGECGAMAWIKTTKDRIQDRKWAREDQEREQRLQDKAEAKNRKDDRYGNH